HAIPLFGRPTRAIEAAFRPQGARCAVMRPGRIRVERTDMALVRGASIALAAVGLISLGACAHKNDGPQPYSSGGGGFLGIGKKAPAASATPGIGVNSYLWRASLDTLAFMPLASADPYGGVIITDWYVNP